MTYTVVSVIGMDICVVEDRIASQWKLQCCRMAVTIYQRLVKLFQPTWRHHRLTIASTIVSILRQPMTLIHTVRYGKANPRLDASLLQ
jgi:hypothetical protein